MEVIFSNTKLRRWIDTLEPSSHAKVIRMIDLLEYNGYKIGPPYSKSLGRRLFELRIYGDQPVRIFYTFHRNRAVLLHGCIKKSHRFTLHELEQARRLLAQLD